MLKDIEASEQEKHAEQSPEITIDDLRNTAKSLEKLASPDREIDVIAKLAVLMDMGLTKEAADIVTKAKKYLWKVKDANRAAKIMEEAGNIEKETKRIQEGKTLAKYKWPAIATAGTVGGLYLGSQISEKNKKDELKNVARKYFSLGRQSAGGA
ncbi:hypothetical protein AYK24_00240 [Thermoplasmatales archaeon SG8-52-4]|nr:MAG: hypothetical protein AYK24_00240 [Thermoplasmatales archaeon SG8-52-4]